MGKLHEKSEMQWPMLGVGLFATDYLDLAQPLTATQILENESLWRPHLSGHEEFDPSAIWKTVWSNYRKGIQGAGNVLTKIPDAQSKVLIILTDGIFDRDGDDARTKEDLRELIQDNRDTQIYVILLCRSEIGTKANFWDTEIHELGGGRVEVLKSDKPEEWVRELAKKVFLESLSTSGNTGWIDSDDKSEAIRKPQISVPGYAHLEKVSLITFTNNLYLIYDHEKDRSLAELRPNSPFSNIVETIYT